MSRWISQEAERLAERYIGVSPIFENAVDHLSRC